MYQENGGAVINAFRGFESMVFNGSVLIVMSDASRREKEHTDWEVRGRELETNRSERDDNNKVFTL